MALGSAAREAVAMVTRPIVVCGTMGAMSKIVRIYSSNADFQQLEALRRNREKRQKLRLFLVEGVRPINQLLAHGWEVDAFVYERGRDRSDWAEGILARSTARVHYELPPDLMAQLSGKTEPSELLAVAVMPSDDLSRIPLRENLLVLIFDRPSSPGNLGTLIRSGDALRADGLVITGHAADLYDPETISASTGSIFALPAVRVGSPRDLEPWFESLQQQLGGMQLVGSDENGEHLIDALGWSRPTCLVLGNETWGMSAHFRARCDTTIRIPIYGSASSLNVACAASIMLYEIDRQRRA
jgi:23S rRNA (uridine2479-2'-O)-methyltransferase